MRVARRTHPQLLAARRGLMLLDVMIGLAIIALTMVLISQLLAQHHAAERAMAERRAAVRQAEWVLTSLELGRPMPTELPFELAWLRDQPATDGRVWVRVRVTSGAKQHASLVGQVPIASLLTDIPEEIRTALLRDSKSEDAATNRNGQVILRSTLKEGAP